MDYVFTILKGAEYFAEEKSKLDPLSTFHLFETCNVEFVITGRYIVRESRNGTLQIKQGELLKDTFTNGAKKSK